MKKLILVAFLTLGMSTFAQVEKKENEKMESRERMSPEERIQKELKRALLKRLRNKPLWNSIKMHIILCVCL